MAEKTPSDLIRIFMEGNGKWIAGGIIALVAVVFVVTAIGS